MVTSILKRVWQRVYRLYAVRHGVTLGKRVHLGIGTILDAPLRLTVEDDVYIGKFCTIECDGKIGAHSMIANHVGLIGRHDHDIRTVGVSVRRAPWIGDADYEGAGAKLTVEIGPDVWVGYGTIILSGTHIGRGAIIAAGSVVVDDVAAYSVVAGCPARRKGKRFGSELISEHERALFIKYGIAIGPGTESTDASNLGNGEAFAPQFK